MVINAVVANQIDSVATVVINIQVGQCIIYSLNNEIITIKSNVDIPVYHKVAIKNHKIDSPVLKYGEKIGRAKESIQIGDHIHTHNLDNM